MAEPNDDPVRIPDETRLFRRINPQWLTYDANRKELRPSGQNYQDSPDGTPMSVFAENIALEHGESPADFLKEPWSDWYLAAVSAGWLRKCGQKVYLDLRYQDANDFHQSHTVVFGTKDAKVRSRIAKQYEWVLPPPDRHKPPTD
jgi:hypothetical protein